MQRTSHEKGGPACLAFCNRSCGCPFFLSGFLPGGAGPETLHPSTLNPLITPDGLTLVALDILVQRHVVVLGGFRFRVLGFRVGVRVLPVLGTGGFLGQDLEFLLAGFVFRLTHSQSRHGAQRFVFRV